MKRRRPPDCRELLRTGRWFATLPDELQSELLRCGGDPYGERGRARAGARRRAVGALRGARRRGAAVGLAELTANVAVMLTEEMVALRDDDPTLQEKRR